MKIGLDASVLRDSDYTGIPRSVYEIVNYWTIHYPDNEYYLFSSVPIKLDFNLPNNVHIILTLPKANLFQKFMSSFGKLWHLFILPKLIKYYDLDVYWGTNYVIPLIKNKNTKYVVTIYDLALFKIKGISRYATILKQKLLIKPTLKNADKIVAISNATKRDIINLFKIDENKTVVSYCGKDHIDTNRNIDIDIINPKLVLDDYFLFISTIEPRKNIITIVKAFDEYVNQTNSKTKLVIAGKRGWKCDDIYKTIETAKHNDQIIVPGFITSDEKVYLLKNARLFLYPSLYEGFGLPILEAFAYNLPVITSNNSSMPEVGGDAALYLNDCFDYIELCNLMISVDNMSKEEKDKLIENMKVQLSLFSWDKNAEEMMSIIQNTK